MKLRNRIALSFIITASLLILIVFATVYEVVRSTAYSNLDANLKKEAAEVRGSLAVDKDNITIVDLNEWLEHEHGKVEINPVFIQLVDKNNNILKKSYNLLDSEIPVFSERRTAFIDNLDMETGELRIIQSPVKNNKNQTEGYLTIAISRTNAEAVLLNLRTVLIITFPLSLLILFFISSFFAEKSISPVHKLIASAEKITKESLNKRIEPPKNKDELYSLTKTINDLLDRLEEAVLHEKQFTADASHDLRTPLATLKGTLEVLIRKKREPEQYEEKITGCINEVDRMTIIIDQLLVLARHESGKVEINKKDISPKPIIEKIIDRLEPVTYAKNIKFNFTGNSDLTVNADPQLTDIILDNVISNAVKYSNQNSEITIDFDKNSCAIIDSGCGMTEEQQEKMFDRFYRSENSRNSTIQGSGLGLAIVKKLSDLQNLNLEVESAPGKGTKFKIVFPS